MISLCTESISAQKNKPALSSLQWGYSA